jgi:hypothetical protein
MRVCEMSGEQSDDITSSLTHFITEPWVQLKGTDGGTEDQEGPRGARCAVQGPH